MVWHWSPPVSSPPAPAWLCWVSLAKSMGLETIQDICTCCAPLQVSRSCLTAQTIPNCSNAHSPSPKSWPPQHSSQLHCTFICEILGLSSTSPLGHEFLEIRDYLVSVHWCVFPARGKGLQKKRRLILRSNAGNECQDGRWTNILCDRF